MESRDRRGGGRRNTRPGEETYRVALVVDELEELRDLLQDVEGDADEDVLDAVRGALGRGAKRELDPGQRVVLRLTRQEKDACRRAIDGEDNQLDKEQLPEILRKIEFQLAKHNG